jgi:crotonobetainyl-CoA:carnitine CoA-transferase CaiB-like acyl-CoA transferase
VLVVSLEQAVAAPLASRLLADAGARVIKVERPAGDFARGYDRAAAGISSYFAWLNYGKESIALDLKDSADRALLERMIASADVFVQNLAVGATDRLGLGSEQLRDRHPRLIVCDISGYGAAGPFATRKAYDLLVQAESGLLSVSGPPGPYGRVGVSIADISTGFAAALAISQALVQQRTEGVGAHLEASLFQTMAELMTVPLLHHDYLDAAPQRVGLAHPSIAPYGAFTSRDGVTILISVQSDSEWRALCERVLEAPDYGFDERFASNDQRVANRKETDAIVEAVFADLPASELVRRLTDARIAFGTINDVAGLSSHPQLQRIAVPHPEGTVSLPAPAVATGWLDVRAVPALDEHGARIRAEFGSA